MAGATAVRAGAGSAHLDGRFSALVASHRERALRLAWRLVGGDDDAAEEIAQEAFFKAYRALPRFREDARLETWFYRILVNQAHRYLRWRAVRERWGAVFHEHQADASAARSGDPLLRRRIARALAGLTRRQREAFVLVHLEGFTVWETAELIGAAEGTVKSHLHRAMTGLRAELADLRDLTGGDST
ncbi:MAG: RNA polymerase sigma factor [Deltaproteobacteria bacterium]|nr:MAG: RNA polymerase sigma factor [Deltaproteobacteria bacterium]